MGDPGGALGDADAAALWATAGWQGLEAWGPPAIFRVPLPHQEARSAPGFAPEVRMGLSECGPLFCCTSC